MLRRSEIVALAAALLVLALLALGADRLDRPLADLTRDPTSAAGASFYLGYGSNLMIAGWLAGAAVALCAGAALRGFSADSGALLAAGALTAVIGLDDLFQFHEELAPAAGIPQKLVLAVYAAAAAWVAWRHGSWLLARGFAPLLAAVLLGVSVGVDLLDPEHETLPHAAEDGPKLLGIALWSVYLSRVALSALTARMRSPAS